MSSCCDNREEASQRASSSPSPSASQDRGGLADGVSRIRVEFAVNVSNQDDLNRVEAALKSKGVNLVSSDISEKMIQFDLPVSLDHERGETLTTTTTTNRVQGGMDNAHSLQRFIEDQTGLLTVVKGLGELNSVVAELRPPDGGANIEATSSKTVMGIVRLSQLADSKCYVDGSLDGLGGGGGLHSRHYSLAIHEFGDLAGDRYENIGQPMIPIKEMNRLNGDGFVVSGKLLENCHVASMIGRSIALSEQSMDETGGKRQVLSAGVIARASTIGKNKKQICSCSGKTLWEERMDTKQADK